MDKHPSPGKIELFLQDKLTADESVEILLHLENCQECSNSIPEPKTEDVLEIFFREEVEGNEDNKSDSQSSADQKKQSSKPGLFDRLKRLVKGNKHHFQN